MTKPKLLFVYYHKYPDKWMDGLWAALNLLEQDFEVERLNLFTDSSKFFTPSLKPDFALGWGAFGSPVDQHMKMGKLKCPMGLCIAGNAIEPSETSKYDVLFYETKWYRQQISFHPNIVRAFGVNTNLFFKPDMPMPIVWDYLGVGSLSSWKRWEKMGDKPGNKLVVGEYQEDNEQESLSIVRNLLKKGVTISNMINPFDLSNLYWWTRKVYIPADINGGGERAVWEAKACGCGVVVEDDNPKLKELAEEEPKDHNWYYEQLKKGIQSCL